MTACCACWHATKAEFETMRSLRATLHTQDEMKFPSRRARKNVESWRDRKSTVQDRSFAAAPRALPTYKIPSNGRRKHTHLFENTPRVRQKNTKV